MQYKTIICNQYGNYTSPAVLQYFINKQFLTCHLGVAHFLCSCLKPQQQSVVTTTIRSRPRPLLSRNRVVGISFLWTKSWKIVTMATQRNSVNIGYQQQFSKSNCYPKQFSEDNGNTKKFKSNSVNVMAIQRHSMNKMVDQSKSVNVMPTQCNSVNVMNIQTQFSKSNAYPKQFSKWMNIKTVK